MALPAFPASPSPVFPADVVRKIPVLSSQFGDGYSQDVVDGFNGPDVADVNIRWELLTTAEKDTLEAFLKARSGAGRFTYAVPGDTGSKTYICREWRWTLVAYGVWSLDATFSRSFDVA